MTVVAKVHTVCNAYSGVEQEACQLLEQVHEFRVRYVQRQLTRSYILIVTFKAKTAGARNWRPRQRFRQPPRSDSARVDDMR